MTWRMALTHVVRARLINGTGNDVGRVGYDELEPTVEFLWQVFSFQTYLPRILQFRCELHCDG